MYKAPPPEISSRAVLRDRPARAGSRAGSRSRPSAPLPIGWAEHVLADGHWGARCASTCATTTTGRRSGVLCELLPQPENRVTLADETDRHGMPVARMDYTQCDNDRANIAYAKRVLERDLGGRRRAGHADDRPLRAPRRRLPDGRSPEDSVIDADHRVWGVPNLFVADGSVMPTQGAANPALTIMALASRLAERLAAMKLEATAYTVPCDAPESDGTFAWDSTTIVVVEAAHGGRARARLHVRPRGARERSCATRSPAVVEPDALDGRGVGRRWSPPCATWAAPGLAMYASRRSTSRSGISRPGCSASAARAAARPPPRRGADLRLRRLPLATRDERLRAQLGGWAADGLRAREDEGRPRPGAPTPAGSPRRARRSAPTWS